MNPDDEDEDALPAGEFAEMDDDDEGGTVTDTDDGGAIVTMDEDARPADGEFYDNVAGDMSDSELKEIASRFIDVIGKDKDARKKRDEQYEEGLRRTGLGDDAPGGASFSGASKVVHPMLTEACVDFAARAMKEIFPSDGPAKHRIVGKPTEEKTRKAERKSNLLNWQMTVQCQEVRSEIEQLMTQVPLGGAQYLKLGWDEPRNRPTFLFVAIDDMYLPYAATNFNTAQRKTHVQYLTQLDYERRVKDGMYLDVELAPAGIEPEQSMSGQANDRIEGRDNSSYNEDGLRIVYEIHTTADIEDDGVAPYIISVDKTSNRVLSIYRNWDEDDETRDEQQWFVEFPFIPWRGAYPIGLPQMIGGLSGAATGALRALLDSAHISNSQTMLKLKGGTSGGQNIQIQPGQTEEIEGGLNVDDVRKLVMPLPYNQPSPVLFSLLGFLVEAGKGVVRTSMEDIADNNPNAPVGTTLAKLEQGAVVYSAIHSRLYDAMGRVLRILSRLNGLYLDDEQLEETAGEELARRADFDGVLDVVPVSDPNIFSEAQRYAQVQAVAQRAAAMPQLYNMRKVEERLLRTLKIPDAEGLLNPPVEPKEQNAVNENVAATLGRPVTAFPEQDHLAHLETHVQYLMNPTFGMNPLIAPTYIPAMLNHFKEHIALWYASTVFDVSTDALGGEDLGDTMRAMSNKDTAGKRALDRMLASAASSALQKSGSIFQQLPQIIQQAQQVMQQMSSQNQPPQDPALALQSQALQIQSQTAQAKAQADAQKAQAAAQSDAQQMQLDAAKMQADQQSDAQHMQFAAQKLQQEAQLAAADLQTRASIEAQRQQAEDQRTLAEINSRMKMNADDNATAMSLAQVELATGERFSVSTGTGINPNP